MEQIRNYSAICRDIAQVFFASFVVAPFTINSVREKWATVIIGISLALIFWLISNIIIKGEKNE